MSAAQLNFSMLLHNFCRVRFQNWIGVVADITVNARQTVSRTVLVYQGATTREAHRQATVLVYHRASTRERSSETGEGHSGPHAGEIRDRRRALGTLAPRHRVYGAISFVCDVVYTRILQNTILREPLGASY